MNNPAVRRVLLAIGAPVSAVVLALLVSSIVLAVSGSNPLDAYGDMLENASRLETMIDTLNEATPLYLSGVAAAIGFRMNLFNIGVEGQYLLAAFIAAVVGAAIELPALLHVFVILVIAMTSGAIYAGIAGVLKVTRGVNEVIATIMLNSIAVGGIIAWLIREFQDEESTTNVGTKPIADSGLVPDLNGVVEIFTREIVGGRELTGLIILAVVVGIAYHLFINRTRLGFDFRASGMNPLAARAGGVPPKRMVVYAMLLSGLVAGLVGMPELLSEQGNYEQSFRQGLGFAGIAVALLGRNNPAGIAVGALLFGFLNSSSAILQVSGSATPEIVVIMQGVIVLAAVISYEVVNRIREREEARTARETMVGAAA